MNSIQTNNYLLSMKRKGIKSVKFTIINQSIKRHRYIPNFQEANIVSMPNSI